MKLFLFHPDDLATAVAGGLTPYKSGEKYAEDAVVAATDPFYPVPKGECRIFDTSDIPVFKCTMIDSEGKEVILWQS